jgi:rhodanese-related sulfurtransferase
MTASDLLASIEAGAAPRILDVRSRVEYEGGHVPGAMHIPFWQLVAAAPPDSLSPEERIVIYCGHGPRARLAGAALKRRGFAQVEYLKGHMSEWRRAGLREERGARSGE